MPIQLLSRVHGQLSPWFIYWVHHDMAWNVPLGTGVSCLCHFGPVTHWWGEKQKTPWPIANTAQQQLNHQYVVNIILTLNPKHITVLANSVPAETRTGLRCHHAGTDWSHHFQEGSQSPYLLAQVAPSEVWNKMSIDAWQSWWRAGKWTQRKLAWIADADRKKRRCSEKKADVKVRRGLLNRKGEEKKHHCLGDLSGMVIPSTSSIWWAKEQSKAGKSGASGSVRRARQGQHPQR